MKLDHRQILTVIILLAGISAGVYILFFDDPAKPESPTYSFSGDTTAVVNALNEDSSGSDSLSSVAGLEPESELPPPSMDAIPENQRIALQLLDHAIDSAYAMPPGAGKTRLLNQIKSRLDTFYGATSNPFCHILYGDYHMMKPNYKKAEEHYSEAMKILGPLPEIKRNLAGARFNCALISIELRDSARGIDYMDKVLQYNPADTQARRIVHVWSRNWGTQLLTVQQNEKALHFLERAAKYKTPDYYVNYNLGLAHFRLNQPDKAIPYFKRSLNQKPGDEATKMYLYVIYTQKGDSALAQKYYVEPKKVDIKLDDLMKQR